MNQRPTTTDPRCPECGSSVHLNSVSCGSCGARRDEQGWGNSEAYDGIDLPGDGDEDFDYEAFLEREFGEENKPPLAFLHGMTTRQRFWWLVGVLTLFAFGWVVIRGSFW